MTLKEMRAAWPEMVQMAAALYYQDQTTYRRDWDWLVGAVGESWARQVADWR